MTHRVTLSFGGLRNPLKTMSNGRSALSISTLNTRCLVCMYVVDPCMYVVDPCMYSV